MGRMSIGHLVVFSAESVQTGYTAQGTAADGGGQQRNLTRRRRFCAVAVRSSVAVLTTLGLITPTCNSTIAHAVWFGRCA